MGTRNSLCFIVLDVRWRPRAYRRSSTALAPRTDSRGVIVRHTETRPTPRLSRQTRSFSRHDETPVTRAFRAARRRPRLGRVCLCPHRRRFAGGRFPLRGPHRALRRRRNRRPPTSTDTAHTRCVCATAASRRGVGFCGSSFLRGSTTRPAAFAPTPPAHTGSERTAFPNEEGNFTCAVPNGVCISLACPIGRNSTWASGGAAVDLGAMSNQQRADQSHSSTTDDRRERAVGSCCSGRIFAVSTRNRPDDQPAGSATIARLD